MKDSQKKFNRKKTQDSYSVHRGARKRCRRCKPYFAAEMFRDDVGTVVQEWLRKSRSQKRPRTLFLQPQYQSKK